MKVLTTKEDLIDEIIKADPLVSRQELERLDSYRLLFEYMESTGNYAEHNEGTNEYYVSL